MYSYRPQRKRYSYYYPSYSYYNQYQYQHHYPKYSPYIKDDEELVYSNPVPKIENSRKNIRTKALQVGINYYGTKNQLGGCINDVKAMERVLVSKGYKEIKQLTDNGTDEYPSRNAMLNGIRWLVEGAVKGDMLFFQYSGHGAQQVDRNGDEIDGKDEILCPPNYPKSSITDDELKELLVDRVPEGVRLFAVMDCCHSGTVFDLSYKSRFKNSLRLIHDFIESKSKGEVVMLSGCRDDQTSADAQGYGAMTSSLLKVYKSQGFTTVEALLSGIREELKRRRFRQIPQLSSNRSSDILNLSW